MPRPIHREHARGFIIGVVTLVVLGGVATVGVLAQGGGRLPLKSYTYLTATFDNVGMLSRLNNVTQNGVRVGQVDDVKYVDGQAVVRLRLDGKKEIYADASASIANFSALGRKMIRLNPGNPSAGPIGPEGIPNSRTSDSQTLDDVLSAFDEKTRKGLRTSLRELGGGMAGYGPGLNDFVSNSPDIVKGIGRVTGSLADKDAQLPELLGAANELAGRFNGREDEIRALLRQTDDTLEALNVDKTRPLDRTISKLPGTLTSANTAFEKLNKPLNDLRVTLNDVKTGAPALGASAEDLRGFLRESVSPLHRLVGVSKQALPAVTSLTKTLNDARPLVQQLPPALADASVLLGALSPYSPDIGRFVSEHDLLSGSYAPDKHYFSAMLTLPGLYSASLPDPLAESDPYPAPGYGAWNDNPTAEGSK